MTCDDFQRVRCRGCQRLYWADDNGCPHCSICDECGDEAPPGEELCATCRPPPTDPVGDEHGGSPLPPASGESS